MSAMSTIASQLSSYRLTDIGSVDHQGPSTMLNKSNQERLGVSKVKHSVVTRIATTFYNQPSVVAVIASCHHDHLWNPLNTLP